MEIKTKYQYTYFIYPYIIGEKKYEDYLYKILLNKKFKIKKFEKEKDKAIYDYFLPKTRDNMFWTLGYNSLKISKIQEFELKMQAVLLSKYPCTIFEYNIKKDIQGKAGKKEDGIFFNIVGAQLICFKTGVSFLLIKTILNEKSTLRDLCNFNYIFRNVDFSKKLNNTNNFENIKIQTDKLKDIKEIGSFIKEVIGNNKKTRDLNIDTEKFIVYSYACVGQEFWQDPNMKEVLMKEFSKFANVEMSDSTLESNIQAKIESKNNFIYGLTNNGTVLITSDVNTQGYTEIPEKYENEQLYSYIYQLHKKIYLKKLNHDFKTKFSKTKEKYINFVQEVMIEDITNDSLGLELNTVWEKVLKIKETFIQSKQKYDVLYKNKNIEKTARSNKIIAVILIALVIINIINSINMYR